MVSASGQNKVTILFDGDIKGLQSALGKVEKETQTRTQKMTAGFNKAGRSMALIGGAALAAFGVAAKGAVDFEKGMREVNTLMGGTEKQLTDLSNQTRALSRELGVNAVDATGALYQAISAGVPAGNVMDFLRTAGEAAIGGVTDLETAVDGLTGVVNAYGAENITAEEAADLLFATVKLGKTTFGELSANLFNVVPIAAASGIEFREVAAALGVLTGVTGNTAVSTTQLRAAIQAVSAPTVRQQKVMEKLGVSFSAAELESKGLIGAFRDMIAAAGDDAELRRLVGSVEALQAVLVLGGEQSEVFAEALETTADVTGDSAAAFKEMEKSSAQSLAKMNSSLTDVRISLGTALLPVLVDVAGGVRDIVTPISEWVSANPELAGGLGKVLVPLAGVATGVGVIGIAAPIAATGISGLATAFTALHVAIAGKVGALFVVAASATAAFIGLGNALRNLGDQADRPVSPIIILGQMLDEATAATSFYIDKLTGGGGLNEQLGELEEAAKDAAREGLEPLTAGMDAVTRPRDPMRGFISPLMARETREAGIALRQLDDDIEGIGGTLIDHEAAVGRFGGVFQKVWSDNAQAVRDAVTESNAAIVDAGLTQAEQWALMAQGIEGQSALEMGLDNQREALADRNRLRLERERADRQALFAHEARIFDATIRNATRAADEEKRLAKEAADVKIDQQQRVADILGIVFDRTNEALKVSERGRARGRFGEALTAEEAAGALVEVGRLRAQVLQSDAPELRRAGGLGALNLGGAASALLGIGGAGSITEALQRLTSGVVSGLSERTIDALRNLAEIFTRLNPGVSNLDPVRAGLAAGVATGGGIMAGLGSGVTIVIENVYGFDDFEAKVAEAVVAAGAGGASI